MEIKKLSNAKGMHSDFKWGVNKTDLHVNKLYFSRYNYNEINFRSKPKK